MVQNLKIAESSVFIPEAFCLPLFKRTRNSHDNHSLQSFLQHIVRLSHNGRDKTSETRTASVAMPTEPLAQCHHALYGGTGRESYRTAVS